MNPCFCSLIFTFVCLLKLTLSDRYYVDSTKSGTTGLSWDTAFQYLDDAIKSAQSSLGSNEIWIRKGTYYPQTTDRTSCFSIPPNTKVYGGFSGTEASTSQRIITTSISSMTILDGDIQIIGNLSDNCYHVVNITHGLLDSIVIRNGNADKDGDGDEKYQFGGGIYVGSDKNVNITLNNVQIINNTAHLGGGLFALQDDNYIQIYQSIFQDNTATIGSYLGGYGGAIHVSKGISVTIQDTEFITNNAIYRGGAIYQDYGATITCENCLFISNSANSGHGGAWFAENRNSQLGTTTSNIYNSNFSSNYAFGYGGACTFLKDSIVNIEDSFFDYNVAQNSGGAITYYDITNLTTSNNEFYNNIANEDSSTNNIYNGSFPDFTTINTTISYNISEYLKELWNNRKITAQYNDNLPPITGTNLCYVKSCNGCSTSSLDGSSWNNSYTTIQECIDTLKNQANSNEKEIWVAKGIYYPTTGLPFSVEPESPYFYSFLMSPNIRMYGGFDGTEIQRSQRNWYLNPTILSCAMSDISCTIIMTAADNVIVDGFIFTGALYNKSRESGNLINSINTTIQPETTLQFTSTISTTQSSTTSTSAFSSSQVTSTKSSSSLPNRRLLSETYNTESEVIQSTSGGRGGGIFSNGTNVTVVNSIFFENLAVKGGGFYCIGLSSDGVTYKSPTITNVAFINNVAVRGGGMMGDVGCKFQCSSCIFERNVASEKGGGIYLDYFCDVSVNNSQFMDNTAYESGGCIASDGFSYALLNNNLFSDNVAKWEGGCLYAGSHVSGSGTTFYIIDPTFQNNSAYYGFDNIWLWPDDGLVLEDNVTINVPSSTSIISLSSTSASTSTSTSTPTSTPTSTSTTSTSTSPSIPTFPSTSTANIPITTNYQQEQTSEARRKIFDKQLFFFLALIVIFI